MRFFYKRPRLDHVSEELETLMDVMVSNLFIYLDLLVFSFIFTMFLSPVFQSVSIAILFFLVSYSFFGSLYYYVISKIKLTK
jgi:hypothetical protein